MSQTARGELYVQLWGSVFITDLEQRLETAATEAELHDCFKIMDTPEFDALPAEARNAAGALYAQRLLAITGALR